MIGLSAIDIEGLYTAETLNLSTGSYGSFMPPESVISVAYNEGLKKCEHLITSLHTCIHAW